MSSAVDHERVSFLGTGNVRLSGVLDRPRREPEAYALFAHCFTGGKDSAAARRVSRSLTERGLAVLRFDFAGVGESGGQFSDTTFSSTVTDVLSAAEYLRKDWAAPSLLIGHSFGGAAVLDAAAEIPETTAVAGIGVPSDPAHVTRLFATDVDDIEAKGQAEVRIGGRPVIIGKQFLADLSEQRLLERVAELDRPLLLLHAPTDEIVEVDHAGAIYRAARHPKSFISLDGADHLLTDYRQARRVARLIAAWADPYLPETFTPECD